MNKEDKRYLFLIALFSFILGYIVVKLIQYL